MIQFPFAAIVGMEDARNSLIFQAIDPRIGGALFLGHRGCAKSTLVRGFAEILELASDRCAPFIEVPLGTTDDRLLGSVDAQSLVEKQVWSGRRGLIEEAHGGVLYIDEINLLPDHLADLILDSASSGQYRMERDGITRFVESRYILVGTMNPEEGDLRPQLSDRFAHGVTIQDDFAPEQRMEIVQRRMEFDDRPESFVAGYRETTSTLVGDICAARKLLSKVNLSNDQRMGVAAKGREFRLEGLRAELAVVRTARCAAAWTKRTTVEEGDLELAWRLCLGHRRIVQNSHSEKPSRSDGFRPFENRSLGTSPAPLDSRPDARELLPRASSANQDLVEWLGEKSENLLPYGRLSERKSNGPIAWTMTLAVSARNGWLQDRARIKLCRRMNPQKEHLWCFLDASRSTGMNQFLARARDSLAGLAAHAGSIKFDLLVLTRAEMRWLCQNAVAGGFVNTLDRLQEAAGKSLIVESLAALHRRITAARGSASPRVIIVSDGLASPRTGEHPPDTRRQIRNMVQRLLSHGGPVAWVAPPPKRGLRRWVTELLGGLAVRRFEI